MGPLTPASLPNSAPSGPAPTCTPNPTLPNGGASAPQDANGLSLKSQINTALEAFFNTLNGHPAVDLYQLVLREVEEPLLRKTLEHTQNNQVKAAQLLGLNRGTLRKKLELYDIR